MKLHELFETRQSHVKYTEKQTKGIIDKVTAELSGSSSAGMTRLAKRYARLEVSLKAMKEKHDELNTKLKNEVSELFDAEDIVRTRIVQTAQFTLSMTKEIQKTEGTEVINYEGIAKELAELVSNELQEKIDLIVQKYTTIIPPKTPIKKLTVSKEVTEGILDNLQKLKSWVQKILSEFTQWGVKYDQKLYNLKQKLNV